MPTVRDYDLGYYLKEQEAEGWPLFDVDGPIRQGPREKVEWFFDLIPGRDILDVGCGRGEQVWVMAEMGARFIMGIDWSPAALRIARKLCAGLPNVQLYRRNAFGFHPGVRFDIVTMFDFIEHLRAWDARIVYFQAATEWLRPGGMLCAICPPHNEDPTHFYHQTQGSMRRDMEAAGFERIEVKQRVSERGYIYVARGMTMNSRREESA